MSTNNPIEFYLYDVDLITRLAVLPVKQGSLYLEFNEPGSGEIKIPLDSAAAALVQDGQFIRSSYRGVESKAFFVDNHQEIEASQSEGAGREMSISGRGALGYLDRAIVYPNASGASTRLFTGMSKGAILHTLFTEAFNRGGFNRLDWDFDNTTSSDSVAWSDSEDLEISVGQKLLDIMRDFSSTGEIEFDVTIQNTSQPILVSAYANGIGSDKSSFVFFRIGVNCQELDKETRGDKIVNSYLIKYKTGYARIENAASIAARGRREELINLEAAQSADSAQTFAAARLDQLKDPLFSVGVKVYDGIKPYFLIDYQLGDTISVDKFGTVSSYRILGIQADFNGNDYINITVEFNHIFYENDLETQRDLNWLLDRWNTARDANLTEIKTWISIGEPDGPVYALFRSGNYLYVGGDFNNITGKIAAKNIARYNTNTGAWEAMSTGITSAPVSTIIENSGDIYAATSSRVYRWTGAAWSILPDPEGTIKTMVSFGSILYIGGLFDLGTTTVYSIASWNGSAWNGSLVHGGITINALIVYKGDLYSGGSGGAAALKKYAFGPWNNVMAAPTNGTNIKAFVIAGDNLIYSGGSGNTVRVYRWDGVSSTREDLFSATTWGDPGGNTHDALASYLSDIYFGSVFTSVNGTSGYGNLAKYSGGVFSNLLDGVSTSIGHRINAISVVNSDVYIGGTFTTAGGKSISNLAVYISSFQSLLDHATRDSGFDLAAAIHSAAASAVTNNDEFVFWEDTSQAIRKITWADIKNTLITLFDTLYDPLGGGGGGGGFGANEFHIDQTGGTSDTFGAIAGTLNGINTDFIVSAEEYNAGSLSVYLNGQLLTQGTAEDWIELNPSTGEFQFNIPPEATDEITVIYQKVNTSAGNADTVDGYHASAFANVGHSHALYGQAFTLAEQGSDPSGPFAAGDWMIYAKSTGIFIVDDGGIVIGPLVGSNTVVPNTRTISATSPIRIDGGASANLSANRTMSILAATTSAAGSMSAADKTKLDSYIGVTNYTPTVTASSGTITTVTASGKYAVFGDLVWYTATATITNAGTASGELRISVPFTANANSIGAGREDNATGVQLQAMINSGSNFARVVSYAGGGVIAAPRVYIISGLFTK